MEHCLEWAHLSHLHGWNSEITGYLASALVLATFCTKSMRPLRLTAIISNVAFISYAVSTDLHPILILHGILLPVNVVRLMQIEIERRRQQRGLKGDASDQSEGIAIDVTVSGQRGAMT